MYRVTYHRKNACQPGANVYRLLRGWKSMACGRGRSEEWEGIVREGIWEKCGLMYGRRKGRG